MLKLTQEQQQQMYHHAQNTYPEECCGLLLGSVDSHRETTVVEIWETDNVWEAENQLFAPFYPETTGQELNKHNRFMIHPAVLLKAQKYARNENLSIVGIYHSHPDESPVPSEFDCAIAWDTYSYLIMSVKAGKVVDCRSWVLNEQEQFQEETIVTEGCH